MATVDFRTRFEGDDVLLDPDEFVSHQLPPLVDSHGEAVGRSATRLNLPPLSFDVEGEAFTIVPSDTSVTVSKGLQGALAVSLDRPAFSDLIQDVASTFGLQMSGRATMLSGEPDSFLMWEPVLRNLLDGRPVYEPGSIQFTDISGLPLELGRSFSLDDASGEIGNFLAQTGFVHLKHVFSEEEMAAVSAELDAAIDAAAQEDGMSWWAQTAAGEWYPARILGFNHQSPTLRALLRDERFAAIGSFTDDDFVQRDPGVEDAAEGLLKKIGVVKGISDVTWHKDCSLGGHSRHCCGLTVGISITGATAENGELGVVPGSHRANTALVGTAGLDLPRLPLPTQTGDITVHCSCTLHMSRPPVSAERRVVYSGFSLAPRSGDYRAQVDTTASRQQRASLSEQSRRVRSSKSSLTTFDL